LGLSRDEIDARFDEIAAFADIGEFIDQPVKVYSSGMAVRLAFAVVACVDPDVLIVDEALAVGDAMFQARCLERIRLLQERGTTTLFVTHDTGTFQNLCDYGYLLNEGQVFSHGRPAHVAMQYYELIREGEHARQRLTTANAEQAERIRAELHWREQEIRAKTDDSEYRFGAGAARITDYRVEDGTGRETFNLCVGEPFRVVVTVAFYDYVANLSIGVMLRNAQGQNLMGMHSFVEHRVNFGAHDAGETLTIAIEQVMLLNPGDYLLHISVADCRSDYDFTSLDYRNNLAKITVFGKPLGYGLIHTQPRFFVIRGETWFDVSPRKTWNEMRWKDWTPWLLERCRRYAPNARRVLEIGGQGSELEAFLSEGERELTTLNFPTDDICRRTAYPDGAFDVIVSKMTFEHLYDPFAAADEMMRLLAPGGVLIALTVWSWRYHVAPGFDDYWRFSSAGMQQLFPALETLEVGYDLDDRRKDCRLDAIPVDFMGGWREHWYVYLVARKRSDATGVCEAPSWRANLALLNCTLEQVRSIYNQVLDDPRLTHAIQAILAHDEAPPESDIEQEERAWPGEPRFVRTGYYRMMLGRYAFAGSQFCRDANVLETCSGLGWGAYLVAHYARRVTAFDYDAHVVDRCRALWPKENIHWFVGDARDLTFLGNACFDVALGMETIEHFSVADGERYVAEVAAHLRPGGVFIGTSAFPATSEEAERMRRTNPFHLHIYTAQEIDTLLRKYFGRVAIIGNWIFIAVR
ncbi:Wzt carbohydrate-binding domain-containing protein, partial [Roseiflexus sp.]